MYNNRFLSLKKYNTIYLLSAAVLVISLLLQGCIPRLIPIQTARVTQMEFYSQYYNFKDAAHAKSVFVKMMGEKNWRVLEEYYVHGDILQDLLENNIAVQGALTLTMSLVPTDHDQLFLEGIGRYFVVRKRTNEIILSGDYYIKNNRQSIADLKKGFIPLRIKQYLIRHFAPGETNYYHDVAIDFRIHMNTDMADEMIYSIDYESEHEVILDGEVIGYLKFDDTTPREDKLIDLRGRKLVKNDYKKIKEKSKK